MLLLAQLFISAVMQPVQAGEEKLSSYSHVLQ
jgi:hypothetical protein